MRLLLDSHTLIWSADRPDQITSSAMTAMSDPGNELLVSAATLWEIAIKFGLGRLPLSVPYRQWMEKAMVDLGLILLPITLDHTERQALLPWHHRDPFDRLLVAQAQVEGVPLVSADATLDPYGITRIW
jgi:PIN domain nuclease of toxin-antitoxin system